MPHLFCRWRSLSLAFFADQKLFPVSRTCPANLRTRPWTLLGNLATRGATSHTLSLSALRQERKCVTCKIGRKLRRRIEVKGKNSSTKICKAAVLLVNFFFYRCPSFETVQKGIQTRALSIESLTFYRLATANKQKVPSNRLLTRSQRRPVAMTSSLGSSISPSAPRIHRWLPWRCSPAACSSPVTTNIIFNFVDYFQQCT